MIARQRRRGRADEIPRNDFPQQSCLCLSVQAGQKGVGRVAEQLQPLPGAASLGAAGDTGVAQRKFGPTANVPGRILSLRAMLHDNKVRRQRLPEQLLPKPEIPGIENHLSIRSQMYIRAIYQAAALQLPLHQACFLSPG